MKKFLISTLIASSFLNAEQELLSNFNEDEYERVERVFANNTGHIDHLADFVKEQIIFKGLSEGSLLDIGAGPATITERLSRFFASTTIIEPNKEFASIYKGKQFNFHIGNFQDIQVQDKYDFVLCSHVLYHVPKAEWGSFLQKMYDLIRPGGKGLVLMVAPKGKWHEMRLTLTTNCSHSAMVEKVLNELKIPYELFAVQSVFKVPNYEDFRALIRLFTLDNCYLPHEYDALSETEKQSIEKKIEEYIKTCQQPDGSFEFFDEDVYILMNKD